MRMVWALFLILTTALVGQARRELPREHLVMMFPEPEEAYLMANGGGRAPRANAAVVDSIKYCIVIDAGSSKTNMFLYEWDSAALHNGTGTVQQVGNNCKTKPGISSYTNNPKEDVKQLTGCMDTMKGMVPETKWSSTRVYLQATAGMRLVREINGTVAEAILHAIRNFMSGFPFKFQDSYVKILPGAQEGVFGWVTANYLMGDIGPNAGQMTVGALDLGGASTQITFVPAAGTRFPPGHSYPLSLYGHDYEPYTYSFLCFGLNEARRRIQAATVKAGGYKDVITSPCHLKGDSVNVSGAYLWQAPCSSGPEGMAAFGELMTTPHPSFLSYQSCGDHPCTSNEHTFTLEGTGNSSQCIKLVQGLFPQRPCAFSSCSFNGTFQPNVTGKFSAFAGYYYQAAFLNLTGSVQLDNLTKAGSRLCDMPWNEVIALPGASADLAHFYCIDTKYCTELLTYGLKFPKDYTISIQNQVNGTEVGWSYGFMVNATNILPGQLITSDGNLHFSLSSFTLSLSLSFLVLFCFFHSVIY